MVGEVSMKVIHIIFLFCVAISLICLSEEYSISSVVVYGVWVSGFFFGLGVYELSKKLKTRTKDRN